MNDIHVRFSGAHILGCNVAAVQALYVSAKGPEHRLVFVFFGIADNHGFAAAQIEPGYSIFVGHTFRQPESIYNRVLFRSIGPHSCSTQCGTECCVMNGDNSL
ncbi:hypothetical protein D3C75_1003440 [compost metagenome]